MQYISGGHSNAGVHCIEWYPKTSAAEVVVVRVTTVAVKKEAVALEVAR